MSSYTEQHLRRQLAFYERVLRAIGQPVTLHQEGLRNGYRILASHLRRRLEHLERPERPDPQGEWAGG